MVASRFMPSSGHIWQNLRPCLAIVWPAFDALLLCSSTMGILVGAGHMYAILIIYATSLLAATQRKGTLFSHPFVVYYSLASLYGAVA